MNHDEHLTPYDGEDLDAFVARYTAAQRAERVRFQRLDTTAKLAEMQTDIEGCWHLAATSTWKTHQGRSHAALADLSAHSGRNIRLEDLEARVALLETTIVTLQAQIADLQRHRTGS